MPPVRCGALIEQVIGWRGPNSYIVAEQCKPPDFVMEIVGKHSKVKDHCRSPRDYGLVGIPEYWRLHPWSIRHRKQPLAGAWLDGKVIGPLQSRRPHQGTSMAIGVSSVRPCTGKAGCLSRAGRKCTTGVSLFRINVRSSGQHKCRSVMPPWYQMMTSQDPSGTAALEDPRRSGIS